MLIYTALVLAAKGTPPFESVKRPYLNDDPLPLGADVT